MKKLKYGKNYKMYEQQSFRTQPTQDSLCLENELKDCTKRFSITKCLNNDRQYPSNILDSSTLMQSQMSST